MVCSTCSATSVVPDRSSLLAVPADGPTPIPDNSPQRLAQLRTQDGRPRLPSPTLQSVLGGSGIQPGRDREAFTIWQNLRTRAAEGDVAASEDLSTLTLMLSQVPTVMSQPLLMRALCESTLDASVLPRHRQEQLGRLCRMAMVRGDRQAAEVMLRAMVPGAAEIDLDTEYRISAAVVAASDRDGQRMLALLGGRKDEVPIVDSSDPLASVLRAHAYELTGDLASAGQALRELPDPRMLDQIRANYSRLQLCAQTADGYLTGSRQEAGRRAQAGASGLGYMIGGILFLVGFVQIIVWLALSGGSGGLALGGINGIIGIGLIAVAIFVIFRARTRGQQAAWLRTNGLSLTARITGAQRTGTEVNDVPYYRFALQVQGPQGPYEASFRKLVPDFQVALLLGKEVRVRADPNNLQKVMLEE